MINIYKEPHLGARIAWAGRQAYMHGASFHPPGAKSEKLNRHNPHRICLVNSSRHSDENGLSQWSLMVIIIINLYGSHINIQASGVIVIQCSIPKV